MLNDLSSSLQSLNPELPAEVLRSFPLPEDFILEAFSPLEKITEPLNFKSVKIEFYLSFVKGEF